ncbi:MAG: hypothetical protein R3F43_16670 [bacterium]
MRFLLFENSLFLVLGATAALIWANVDFESYHHWSTWSSFTPTSWGTPTGPTGWSPWAS